MVSIGIVREEVLNVSVDVEGVGISVVVNHLKKTKKLIHIYKKLFL